MYVVVNTKSRVVMCPNSCGFIKNATMVQDEREARAFAEFCAKKWQDQEFALLGVVAKAKSSAPPVEWT